MTDASTSITMSLSNSCIYCGKKFTTKQSLKYHTKNKVCLDKMKYKCNICEVNFKTKSRLDRHKARKKKCKKKYVCQYCEFHTKYKSNIIRHLKDNCKNNNSLTVFGNGCNIGNSNNSNNSNNGNNNSSFDDKTTNYLNGNNFTNDSAYENGYKSGSGIYMNGGNVIHITNINNSQNTYVTNVDNSKIMINNTIININTCGDNGFNKSSDMKYINVNDFGKDNLSYITRCDVLNMMSHNKPHQLYNELLKFINFNKDHPENHNIRMTNINKKKIEVKRGGIFESANRNDIYQSKIFQINGFIRETVGDNYFYSTCHGDDYKFIKMDIERTQFNCPRPKSENHYMWISRHFDDTLKTVRRNGSIHFNGDQLLYNKWGD